MVSSASPSPALQSWLSHGALGAVLTPAVGDPRTATATSEPSCIESYSVRPYVFVHTSTGISSRASGSTTKGKATVCTPLPAGTDTRASGMQAKHMATARRHRQRGDIPGRVEKWQTSWTRQVIRQRGYIPGRVERRQALWTR